MTNDPSISTPTKTSPVAAAQRHAGQGVIFGPENRTDSSSGGTSALAIVKEKARIEGISNVWDILYIREVNF